MFTKEISSKVPTSSSLTKWIKTISQKSFAFLKLTLSSLRKALPSPNLQHAFLITAASMCFAASAEDKGLTIYYIRHAEGGHNVKKDWADVPKDKWPSYVGDQNAFTPKGKVQLAAVAGKLKKYKFDFIAASPMWRCRNTIMPYLKETKSKSEIWPELRELRASSLIISSDLPVPTKPILGAGDPVKLPSDETTWFSLREDGKNKFKVPRSGDTREHDVRSSAAARVVIQRVLDMIQKRFGGTNKTILLSGHGSSGKAVLRMLTNDPLKGFPGISNTGIWMVKEQTNGEFKVMVYNDAPASSFKEVKREKLSMFQRMDKNKDGVVDSKEYLAVFMADARHKDSNEDGLLTIKEFPFSGSFKVGDIDKSGTLTLDETKDMYLKQYNSRDKNNDGKVTADEMK